MTLTGVLTFSAAAKGIPLLKSGSILAKLQTPRPVVLAGNSI